MLKWGVEDLDFSLKCWLSGHRILHDPKAVVGHRFRTTFDNFDSPIDHFLVNQLRMAWKNFTEGVWIEWLDRTRRRHCQQLSEHPEGLWARVWKLFCEGRESADRERAHLHGHRVHDEFWYADRFGLNWPRLALSPGESAAGGFQSPAAKRRDDTPDGPSPSPPPPDKPCCGPFEIEGPEEGDAERGAAAPGVAAPRQQRRALSYTLPGDSVTLNATSTDRRRQFDASRLHWRYDRRPADSTVADLPDGTASVQVRPDVAGQYDISASCEGYSSSYTVYAIGIRHETVAAAPANNDNTRTRIGVGEQVTLTILPDVADLQGRFHVAQGNGYFRISPNGTAIMQDPSPRHTIVYNAPPRGRNTTVRVTIHGVSTSVPFTIVEPQQTVTATAHADYFAANSQLAGQGTHYTVRFDPADVSFRNVRVREGKVRPSHKRGFFSAHNPPAHTPLPPANIQPDNTVVDDCYIYYTTPYTDYKPGTFSWVIPLEWQVLGQHSWNPLRSNTQTFTMLDNAGTTEITKFGMTTAPRTPGQ
jgi:hypothetical protein